MVTDYGEGDRTDFIMSKRGYEKMARPNMAPQLLAYGVVDIEYRRVPCSYNRNLELRIHENSNYPSYLALAPIYKDGMSDITGIDIGLVYPLTKLFLFLRHEHEVFKPSCFPKFKSSLKVFFL